MHPNTQGNIDFSQIAYPKFFRRVGSSFVDLVSGIGLVITIEFLIEIFLDILLFFAVILDVFFDTKYFVSNLVTLIKLLMIRNTIMLLPDNHIYVPVIRLNISAIIIASITCLLIFARFESSFRQTLGKRLFKLLVVNKEYKRISFKHAIYRNLAKIITVCTLGIGYFLILFSNKTLHDKICGTFVVNDSSIDRTQCKHRV